ncbi:MAG: RNA polymerase sigma factor [Spirochaetes bacterium]|nr:RNA polymerase sigma factor [Spirochaetota bacterium]MBX3720985.1 RNA polymerase sigma factor [Turneriella sp.]
MSFSWLSAFAAVAGAVAHAADFMARLMPYRERLFRLALAQLHNTSDAEDAVQEALIKAGRNAQTFRSESSEYTWVVRILINHCHDVQRKVSRRQKREVAGEVMELKGAQIADTRASAEQNIELSEMSRHLMDAVNELGQNYKPLILMRYFEDMSYEDIAGALEINLGTVKSRMNQAKALLREKLVERGIGEDILG